MDPCRKVSFPACPVPSRTARTPHQTNLILTELTGPLQLLFPVNSSWDGGVTEKGPLIAGFY